MSRTNKTKELLAQSLTELMVTTPLEKISVNDIVEHAGVGRNTFYYHFADINELVAWIYNREIVSQLASCQKEQDWAKGLDLLLRYIETNRHFCLNTFHSPNHDLLGRLV